MRIDWYTKAVLTVIAIMLTVIACKPLISPETTTQSTPFAGVQANGGSFFDPRTGEIWSYSQLADDYGRLIEKQRLTKLGQPLVLEYDAYAKPRRR
jgi:hypothetical protein